MAKVVLHAADLLDAARKMEDAANRIDKAIQNLDSTMSDLDGVWSDDNSKQYLARYEELKQEFPGFKAAVRKYSEFLTAVVNTYQRDYIDEVKPSVF